MTLDEATAELIVALLLVLLTRRTPVGVQLLGLLASDANARRVEPVLAAVTAHVEPATQTHVKAFLQLLLQRVS